MGVPVVSFRHGGIPEAVAHGVTGLLSAERDWRGLAADLAMLCLDDARWRQMSEAARKRVTERFDLVRQTRTLETLYEETIGRATLPGCAGTLGRRTPVPSPQRPGPAQRAARLPRVCRCAGAISGVRTRHHPLQWLGSELLHARTAARAVRAHRADPAQPLAKGFGGVGPIVAHAVGQRLFLEISPYLTLARRYEAQLAPHTAWLRHRTLLGSLLRALGCGHYALPGLPLIAVLSLWRVIQSGWKRHELP